MSRKKIYSVLRNMPMPKFMKYRHTIGNSRYRNRQWKFIPSMATKMKNTSSETAKSIACATLCEMRK